MQRIQYIQILNVNFIYSCIKKPAKLNPLINIFKRSIKKY